MSLFTILGIAVALAMDAFAVAIGVGISLKQVSARQTFRLSYHFGLFQAMMPVIGWWCGMAVRDFIENYAAWIAFGLLAAVGSHMIREAFKDEEEEISTQKDSTRGFTLVLLSVATSIDALVVGFSISLLKVSIVTPAIIIGVVACLFTILGLYLGKRVASFEKISKYADIIGGVVLWLIGIKILAEHHALTPFFS